jgi:molybdopterin-guanine dinucleotide biosynthesis protein A
MSSKDLFDNVTGVILAGGRSLRMGRDKTMLKIGGVTLFERILGIMNDFFSNVIIAGDRPDLTRPDVPCYPDRYTGSALGGLYTGLLEAKTEKIFVSSCDMPFPDTAIIRMILSESEGYDAVVPKPPGGFEPLFALYRKTCLGSMHDMLERDEYRIYDFYSKMRVRYLSVEELPSGWQWSLMNINTPEEYDCVKERHI